MESFLGFAACTTATRLPLRREQETMHSGEEEVVARPSGPTIARWQLGRQLRELRDQARYSHAQIADVLACSESKIYKIESGDVGVGRGDLLVMLDRYKVSESQRETMIDLQRQGK